MRVEVEPITYAVRVYDDDRPDDYVATCLIRKYVDRGWMSQISSPRLFEAMPEHFERVLDEIGVVCFEGYMSEPMARAVRMASHGWAEYYIARRGICAGRTMPWVVLSKIDNLELETTC